MSGCFFFLLSNKSSIPVGVIMFYKSVGVFLYNDGIFHCIDNFDVTVCFALDGEYFL